LGGDFELYFHQKMSPNDENISFGQLVCYRINQLKNIAKDSLTVEAVG
jgi:hydrogenase maturation factor HypF (carbamoyltransferase family)